MEEKQWKNEELRRLEEELPRLKECHFEEASRLYEAKTGVRCDGFHPKVPLDLTTRNKRRNCGVLREGGAPSLHDDVFLDTEECHERDRLR